MVDIMTHQIIDLIPSRDATEVIEWLKTYPNIKIISRDGSIVYKNAIMAAHPEAVQISDRFHLLKNLTSYCKDYLIKLFNTKIKLPLFKHDDYSSPNSTRKLVKEEKVIQAIKMKQQGLKNSYICKSLHLDIRTLHKILEMSKENLGDSLKTKTEKIHEQRTKKKQEIIDQVRSMYKKCKNKSIIARELNIDFRTVSKYLSADVMAINGNYGVKKKSILDPFLLEINAMVNDGLNAVHIEKVIRKKGYIGSYSTLSHYLSNLKKSLYTLAKENSSETVYYEWIERSLVIKLLFKPLSKIKNLSEDVVNKMYVEYPILKKVIDIVNEFRAILKNKDITFLNNWITRAASLNINEINSFIIGMNRDIIAVQNAIIYDYSNGLAEGSVNKLKVIKRIMYGRSNFDMLRNKVLQLENQYKIN